MKLNALDIQHFINIQSVLAENGRRVDSGTMMRRLDELEQQQKLNALSELSQGHGYLEPLDSLDKNNHNLSIIFDEGKSISNVYEHEAFAALKSSRLSREQISDAVVRCKSTCKQQIDELFKLLDEKEHLDSLIKTEVDTNSLIF